MSAPAFRLAGLAALSIAVVLADEAGFHLPWLRIVAGLLLTTIVPGVALLGLLLPQPGQTTTRRILAVPTSFAILGLLGVAVERLGFVVGPATLITGATIVTAACLLLAAARSPQRPPAAQPAPPKP